MTSIAPLSKPSTTAARSTRSTTIQAFTPGGKLVKAQVQQAEPPLKQDTYDRIQKSGLPMPVSIKLAPGQYLLHLGVRDNRTGQFGTSELPLSITETPAH